MPHMVVQARNRFVRCFNSVQKLFKLPFLKNKLLVTDHGDQ